MVPTFVIDGSSFTTLEEFYDEFSRRVIPDVSWGRSLDALDDALKGGLGTPAAGFRILWRNAHLSRERLGHAETTRELQHRLQTCHPSDRRSIRQQLNAASRGAGPTVFEWVCDILRSNPDVMLEFET